MNHARAAHITADALTNRTLKSPELLYDWRESVLLFPANQRCVAGAWGTQEADDMSSGASEFMDSLAVDTSVHQLELYDVGEDDVHDDSTSCLFGNQVHT